jgi:hypothetical protein
MEHAISLLASLYDLEQFDERSPEMRIEREPEDSRASALNQLLRGARGSIKQMLQAHLR